MFLMLRANEILDVLRMRQSLGLHPTGSLCDRPSLDDMAQRACKEYRLPKREAYAESKGIVAVNMGGIWSIPYSDLRTRELLWYEIEHSVDEAPLDCIGATKLNYQS